MQEIASEEPFCIELQELLDRYKNKMSVPTIMRNASRIFHHTLSIRYHPELHGKEAVMWEDELEHPSKFPESIPKWIADQMNGIERAAFVKWYTKIQNEIEANKVGDTLQSNKPFIHHCSPQEIAEADCDGDIRHCKDACHKRRK